MCSIMHYIYTFNNISTVIIGQAMNDLLLTLKHLSCCLLILFITTNLKSQESSVKHQTKLIIKAVNKHHYQAKAVDDQFSELLYQAFIDGLDQRKLIFSSVDLEQLMPLSTCLDDKITTNDFTFIDEITVVYQRRINELIHFLEEQKKIKHNINTTDSLHFVSDDIQLSVEAIRNKYTKLITFYTLDNYCSSLDSTALNSTIQHNKIDSLRSDIIERELCWLRQKSIYAEGLSGYISKVFLKALSSTYDPHTTYLSPDENDYFNNNLSKESQTFGFEVYRNNRGEIEIEKLYPGGSAWVSNQINEGDVITAIKTTGHDKVVVDCAQATKVAHIIYSDDVQEAQFTLRKKSGEVTEVELLKSPQRVEENVIKSFVLKGEKKLGYIYLPSFYMDGCANDVAKEIIKLKGDGIEGLIVDLRNNSGGSMYEAISMAGIFINYGALCISHTQKSAPITIKDMNRGMGFVKPLLILQNQYSASASEMFAAALQDYNRAVIVGAQSYGKSTIQQIIPLGNNLNESAEYPNRDGYLKLTIGKFYRIDGTTHQKVGVSPDIKLPTLYDSDNIGEGAMKNALLNDTITKKVYASTLKPLPIDTLVKNSKLRVSENASFAALSKNNLSASVPLNFEAFTAFYFEKDTIPTSVAPYTVERPTHIKALLHAIEEVVYTTDSNNIINDIYINESYTILNDLINIE